jgi:8-oxoguanine deaminase
MAGMSTYIRNAAGIFGQPGAGGLLVDDGVIAEIVPAGGLPGVRPDRTLDARDHIVLPGLINTHHHFYQTLTRACGPALNKPLFPWLQALYPVWAGLDEESLRAAVRLALVELLLSGCTTAVDHHYVFPAGLERAVDIEVEEARALGMRVVLTRGSMSLSEEDGGLPPRSVVQRIDAILRDSERVVAAHHQRGEDAMVQVALAPCSPFSVSTDLMRETARLAESLDVRMHTHLGETEDENRYCTDLYGCRPVDYLERVGWMSDRTWLAHGIHFTPDEISRLGRAKVGIAHCPSSNMMLASGACQVVALQAAGCPVGLAVDGSASNDCSNMAQEVRQAFLLGRLAAGAEAMTHGRAIGLATSGSAAVLGRPSLGSIAVGNPADLALYSLREPRFSGYDDPLAAFVLCGAHSAAHVMVGGRWLVESGAAAGVDMDELMDRHRTASKALLARAAVPA